jgi:hypothetical protein
MRRGLTPAESAWPIEPGFEDLAVSWAKRMSERFLALVWEGYDLLRTEMLDQIDWNLAVEQLERSITMHLEACIHQVKNGGEPFGVQHERPEEATRTSAQAKPPANDIAFYPYFSEGNPRWNWPIEAKVLDTDQATAEYVKAVRGVFLGCIYAPFTGEGAMVGFLRTGNPQAVLIKVSQVLPCVMSPHPSFSPPRAHSVSDHQRTIEDGKSFCPSLRCHHLIMPVK